MKGNETKAEIVRIGAEVIGLSGFNATGIDAVLKRAGVPKGSFYYYFSSKEDFGLAVIQKCAADLEETLHESLKEDARSPLKRLREYMECGMNAIATNQCKKGCLIGNLAQELASQNEKFRKRLDEVFRLWSEKIEACFEEAKRKGELSKDADAKRLAEFLLTGWEGAILRSKVMKSSKPIKDFIDVFFDRLLKQCFY